MYVHVYMYMYMCMYCTHLADIVKVPVWNNLLCFQLTMVIEHSV